MQTYETYHTVSQDDLDSLNHVNNVRYVQWVQDIAEAHWKSKATPDIQDAYVWVLMQHTIVYKNEAVLGDALKLKTYVRETTGVTSIRMVEIYEAQTDKLLVSSETRWCFVNAKTKRPARIPQAVVALFS